MRIPRIYTPQPLAQAQMLELEPAASQHLLTVLRLKPGAALVLFDGSGREFDARLDAAENRRARVILGAERAGRSESPLTITLAQGVARAERMDYTLQKAVELGVSEIIPLLTERSVVRLDEKQAARKLAHWRQLVIGACEQSGRVRVPQVRAALLFGEFLATSRQTGLNLLLDPAADAVVSDLAAPEQNRILLLVGPEGGLSESEITSAQRAGFVRLRLGPRILRTETAALVALSLLQARWGDLSGN